MMLYRIALPIFVIVFYGSLFLVGALGFQEIYDNILYGLGIVPFAWPFVDAHAILSAAQCHREGVDVLISNPCDVLNRPLSYSPLWLDLVPRFATTEHTFAVGVAFNLMFVAALYAVLRPASWREWACLAVACTSTAVTFAVERGNIDLIIFALAALAAMLYGRGPTARLAAYAICIFGGLLKFYPFVLLALSLRETLARFVKIAMTASVAFVVFLVSYREPLLTVANRISTRSYFGDLFGAKNLPFGMVELRYGAMDGYKLALAYSIFLVAVAACLVIALFFIRTFDAQRIRIDWTRHEARCLLIGSLLIVGCFFAGQSVGYRGIHLLLVLPGLMMLWRSTADRVLRHLLLFTIGAVLFVMWQEGIRHSFEYLLRLIGLRDRIPGTPSQIFWVMRELIWWWVVSVLTGMVALFFIRSPSARIIVNNWASRQKSSTNPTGSNAVGNFSGGVVQNVLQRRTRIEVSVLVDEGRIAP